MLTREQKRSLILTIQHPGRSVSTGTPNLRGGIATQRELAHRATRAFWIQALEAGEREVRVRVKRARPAVGHERYLTKKKYATKPVTVENYPKDIKAVNAASTTTEPAHRSRRWTRWHRDSDEIIGGSSARRKRQRGIETAACRARHRQGPLNPKPSSPAIGGRVRKGWGDLRATARAAAGFGPRPGLVFVVARELARSSAGSVVTREGSQRVRLYSATKGEG